MLGGDDLGRHTAAPLSAARLVRQRLADQGKGKALGPGFLDSTVS